MSIKAMKQALEALKRADKISGYKNNKEAITSLRQAIEQYEKQEPVAWDVFNKYGRIYFAIGNQSFPVAYTPEDEPDCSAGQAAEWYMNQLRHALTRIATPQPQQVEKQEYHAKDCALLQIPSRDCDCSEKQEKNT